MKKAISLFMAIVIVVGMFSCLSVTSFAASDEYLSFGMLSDGESYGIRSCSFSATGDIVIPSTYEGYPVTYINNYAFYGCTEITSVTIPETVTEIGSYAFNGCTSLKSVKFINGAIRYINKSTFEGCTALTAIAIPDSVVFIFKGAFRDCSKLSQITIGKNVKYISDEVFTGTAYYNNTKNWVNNVLSIGSFIIKAKETISGKYTVKSGIKCIATSAFSGAKKLTSVTIPNSVSGIGDNVFRGCTGLAAISIGNGIIDIGSGAFYGTAYYNNSKNWSKDILYINKYLISAKTYNVSGKITVKSGTLGIADRAFYSSKSITSVSIPGTVKSIGWYAFEDCPALTSVSIAYGVNSIGQQAFYDCQKLKAVTIPSSVKYIEDAAFGYYENADYENTAVSGFTVSGVKGTAAEQYAADYGLKFKAVALPATPKLTAANSSTGITLKWNAVSGAKGYYLYRKTAEGKWSRIATLTALTYTDKSVASGTNYTYGIKSYNNIGVSAIDSTGITIRFLSRPKITVTNAAKAVTVKWSKIKGATGYIVYRKAGSAKSWTRIATIDKNSTVSYSDKNVKNGTNYTYTVKAYYGKTYSSIAASVTVKFLSPTVIKSAVSGKSGITLKFSKISSGTGYSVYRKTTGKWSRIAVIKGNTKTTYVDTKAKKGTTYTYTVRVNNGSYQSANSNTKACKDKY